jgi:hypothetical protein
LQFSVRAVDLTRLNTLTKYPSISTYHPLDPQTGAVLDEARRPPPGEVVATEKVDGTNSRIVLLPDGSYLLGSREEFLYAQGDLISNPAQGIVAAVRPVADGLPPADGGAIVVVYGEVYGGKVTAASIQYTSKREVGYRVFDVARIENHAELLALPIEELSAWREAGGQTFLPEDDLQAFADRTGLKLTPRVARFPGRDLPTKPDVVLTFLEELIPTSRCRLDAGAEGEPEGLVVRTADRGWVIKLRFEDYRKAKRRKRR